MTNELTDKERIAILETQNLQFKEDLQDIRAELVKANTTLDSIVELKAKGLGVIGLVTLLLGSGLFGVFYTIIQYFINNSKPHL